MYLKYNHSYNICFPQNPYVFRVQTAKMMPPKGKVTKEKLTKWIERGTTDLYRPNKVCNQVSKSYFQQLGGPTFFRSSLSEQFSIFKVHIFVVVYIKR